MPFCFSLKGVLRYRQSLERRERLRLEQLLAQRAHLGRQLEELHSRRVRLMSDLQDALQAETLAGSELHLAAAQYEGVARTADRLRAQLEQLRNEILLQTRRYWQERQQREVLESLRQQQLLEYELVQQRHEQAMLDELYLIRRHTAGQRLPT